MEEDKNIIDYKLLALFIDFYKSLGFKEIETPWMIPKEYQEITFPELSNLIGYKENYLVGSAEQSFLYMDLNNKLKKDYYMSVTPCFRMGDNKDYYHNDYFIKLELYINKNIDFKEFINIINKIKNKYNEYLNVEICKTFDELSEISFDIVTKESNIELGSYGIRSFNNIKWFYGTGIALPRFSKVMK